MLSQLPITSRDARTLARLMFSGALICTLDQQGQIPLPKQAGIVPLYLVRQPHL